MHDPPQCRPTLLLRRLRTMYRRESPGPTPSLERYSSRWSTPTHCVIAFPDSQQSDQISDNHTVTSICAVLFRSSHESRRWFIALGNVRYHRMIFTSSTLPFHEPQLLNQVNAVLCWRAMLEKRKFEVCLYVYQKMQYLDPLT